MKQTVAQLRRTGDGFEADYDAPATIVEEHPDEVFTCTGCGFELTEVAAAAILYEEKGTLS